MAPVRAFVLLALAALLLTPLAAAKVEWPGTLTDPTGDVIDYKTSSTPSSTPPKVDDPGIDITKVESKLVGSMVSVTVTMAGPLPDELSVGVRWTLSKSYSEFVSIDYLKSGTLDTTSGTYSPDGNDFMKGSRFEGNTTREGNSITMTFDSAQIDTSNLSCLALDFATTLRFVDADKTDSHQDRIDSKLPCGGTAAGSPAASGTPASTSGTTPSATSGASSGGKNAPAPSFVLVGVGLVVLALALRRRA